MHLARPAAAVNGDGTYNETTGSTANTWTNYTNAGGNQGPTIGQYATVEIACVVQGFKVADGNTNWYLVASSPWTYQYYVSADPFYNNGQTSGSLHGTPFVDPSIPSCNSGVSGVPETAGSAANTWTNYTNAGGQQGPTIGGGSTVIITCKLSGFRVADSNTWWYQVGSHPWNNSYYVSADAFYNNGATSGSLRGTPFVDPNVPTCSTSVTPSTGNETVGGTANTWTNYTNAGGNQGPSIPNGTTVGITCKLTGFRVADGNTWWYEIGSSPWNNNYFVSADAFYNNGATSGSLRGTPFVDPAVPDCTPSGGGNTRPNTETAGSSANTWANYSHAGGTQGPTIPNGSQIVVTCRAQGFRVADGNTWWYQIASAPWSNVYYVSADPFYNNGATSGSLSGTPFYDSSVPVCVNNQEAPLYYTSVASGRATSHSPTCTYGHYPVNCASGDFWHTFTDVSVPGRGPDLTLNRTYNSLAPTSGGLFGYGWTSTWDQSLSFNSGGRTDGSIVVTLDDGSQITATPDGNGGYTTPPQTDSSFHMNSDGTYTLTLHHLSLESFSASGQLISLSDLNGNATTFSYNGNGQLATVTDSAGRQATVTVGSNGLVSSLTDPLGRTTTYAYDGSNNLTSVTDPQNRTWTYTFESSHRMLTMTDPRGGTVTNTYDPTTAQITKQVDPAGLATTFAYTGDNFGSVGGTTTMTDPHGNVRLEQYANGFLMQVTRALGTPAQATTSYSYDPATFAQTTATDPNGHTTTRTFDAAGHVLTSTDPLGNTTSYTYNSLGEVLTTTTPLGHTTSDTYDANGNLLTTTDPHGNVTTNTYSSTHPSDLLSTADPDGDVTQMSYDNDGNVSSKTVSPSTTVSDTTRSVYDADGELVCQASPSASSVHKSCQPAGANPVNGTISQMFNAAGELTSSTDANGHTTSYTYDGNGNRKSVTDPTGNETATSYDPDNRVTGVTSGANTSGSSTITTAYDIAAGSASCPSAGGATYCTTSTNANGAITTHVFDANDHEVETVRPGGQTTSSTFDLAGNKLTQTAADGVVTTFGYDADNRLTSITYSDGQTPSVSYTYDADGRRTSMSDGSGMTTYAYDADGRLVSETNGAGTATAYSYDADGNVASQSYPNGKTVTRTYNGAGWLSSVTDWLGNTTTFGYGVDGNLISTTYPNGDIVRSIYDAADNLTRTSATSGSTTLASIAYARTAANLISREADSGAITGGFVNSYDAKNQLTQVGAKAFTYDPAGNITTNSGYAQTFNNRNELTGFRTAGGNSSVSYDANGNRTDISPATWGRDTRYNYDAANRLTATSSPAVTPTVTGLSLTRASQAGGGVIAVSGHGFLEATAVHFGTTAASGLTVISDTRLQVTVPAGAVGVVDVTVTAAGATSATTSADQYTYTAAPGVTGLSPAGGPTAAGSTVQINGAGFTGVTRVLFGTSVATSFTVNSDSSITATAPSGSSSVPVSVRTPNGISTRTGGSSYTYADGPNILSTSPSSGPAAGGTTVTMHGSGFTGATSVAFGANAASNVSIVSDNTLTATAAAGTGLTDILVTGPSGISSKVTADHYTYAAAPKMSAVSPRDGSSDGGNTVTITGSGFTTASVVYFGNNAAISHVVSGTTLLAIAPRGSGTKDITVTTPGGTSATTTSDVYSYAPATTGYIYDGGGLRQDATMSSGGTTTYTWDTVSAVPQLLNDGTYNYIYGQDGSVIEQIDTNNNPSYYVHDAIGSTRVLLGATGQVAGTFTYTPYGSLTAQTGATSTPVLFAGAYLDGSTNLYYLVHRYYDPATAQFVSIDPKVQTTNEDYGYAGNDPTNEADADGQKWYNPVSWSHSTWDKVNYGIGFIPVVSLVWGGAQALGGYASATGTCFGYGWASNQCSNATWNATMQALTFGVSNYIHIVKDTAGAAFDAVEFTYSSIRDASSSSSVQHGSSSGSMSASTSQQSSSGSRC